MISPKDNRVDIPIDNGFVGMVDRDVFDEFLRERAAAGGAVRRVGTFERLTRDEDGVSVVHFTARPRRVKGSAAPDAPQGLPESVRARAVIGADGAKSKVGLAAIPGAKDTDYVFAYHEIVRAPAIKPADYDGTRCDVYYRGTLSPDFYGWVFPHGDTLSIGTGSADKGFSLRGAVGGLREAAGLGQTETLRREGAPLPMKPLRKWDETWCSRATQPAWSHRRRAKASTTRWPAVVWLQKRLNNFSKQATANRWRWPASVS
jgi:geranylgeranyl reductase